MAFCTSTGKWALPNKRAKALICSCLDISATRICTNCSGLKLLPRKVAFLLGLKASAKRAGSLLLRD